MFEEEKAEGQITALHIKEEEDLVRMLAKKYNIPYLNLMIFAINVDALALVPEADARHAELAVIQQVGKRLKIAIRTPNNAAAKALIAHLEGQRYKPELFLVSHYSLGKAWSFYEEVRAHGVTMQGVFDLSGKEIQESILHIKTIAQLKETLAPHLFTEEAKVSTLALEIILGGSVGLEASDVHIEPTEKETHLRIRIDGVMQDVHLISVSIYHLLLSRIKLLAGIKLNIKDRAQDGRFTIRTADVDIEVRASTLPGPYGESVALRVLHPRAISFTLEALGMQGPVFEFMLKELKKPNGMILTTGPTGSGKTTTLYAFLKKIVTPSINTITIEDPIEYHLQGVTQTQVDKAKGYTFENGLPSILRQDPDVILVGEIRNKETAETALHAALTGHLVFSTLHTNNAPGTIPRLIDLGASPNIIAPAVNIAMAQRLVRRLCTACRREHALTAQEKETMERMIKALPAPYKKPNLETVSVWSAVGCVECNNTGYRGRIGIFEVFSIDDAVENAILKNPSEAEVRILAQHQGMLTMQQDGILKIIEGITSLEEVERITGE